MTNEHFTSISITDKQAAGGFAIPEGWEINCVMLAGDAAVSDSTIVNPSSGGLSKAGNWIKSLPVLVLRRIKPKTRKVIRFVEDAEGGYQEVTFSWGHKMERRFEFLTGLPRYRREETEEPIA